VRIVVAGATGALGSRLVPLLVEGGHQVVGLTRSSEKAAGLRAVGAEPVVADGLDRDAVLRAVRQARPEVVLHQLTALAGMTSFRKFDEGFALTNRLRTEGTDHLLAAARASGVRRLVAQSFGGWPLARVGGLVKTEDAPLDPDPPAELRRTLDAIRHLESAVLGAEGLEGVVLRAGTGVWSFVHIDDAAAATVAAIERGAPGRYHIVDDDPAPVSAWLPALAAAIGAKPPRRVPGWVGRLAAGEHGVVLSTEVRGASNAKAKRELGWKPAYPSWRQGFRTGLGRAVPGRMAVGHG
jgi:nucleoside-diphosphate-sugar epimerase